MIPSIDRKEWYGLVTGSIEPRLSSRLLKIKLSLIRRKVNRGILTPRQAVVELFKDCDKNYDLYKQDLQVIFGNRKKENIDHS